MKTVLIFSVVLNLVLILKPSPSPVASELSLAVQAKENLLGWMECEKRYADLLIKSVKK
jgi:hypothetical protein